MILVLLDVRKRTDGGSRLINDLLAFLPRDHDVVVLADSNWGILGNVLRRCCFNPYVRYLKRRSEFACLVYLWVYYELFARLVTARLTKAYRSRGVKHLWCVSNEIVPLVASRLKGEFSCSLHVSIQDIPWTYQLALSERELLRQRIEEWLPGVTSWDVQSPGMEQHLRRYLPREGRGVVIWSSAGVPVPPVRHSKIQPQIVVIAFCGSLRFRREFDALVSAVTLLNGRRAKPIQIRLYAVRPHPSPLVSWRGYVETDTLIADLESADLAYSPLGFGEDDRLLAETSFPGKIATYLRAGVPILAHAPEYASNVRFVRANHVGLAVTSLDPQVIARELEIYESALRQRALEGQRIREAVAQHFAVETRRAFFGTLAGRPEETGARNGAKPQDGREPRGTRSPIPSV